MAASGEQQLERALELCEARPAEAAALLRALVLSPGAAEDLKSREAAVQALASLLAKQGDAPALRNLLTELRPLFALIPKAKTAKLVRLVIDAVATVPDTTALQVELCKEQVAWTHAEKRTFLRHRVELRLASLYIDTRDYTSALALISSCVPRAALVASARGDERHNPTAVRLLPHARRVSACSRR
jgi:26S proteasome regulatory subunit N6